ncbi:LysM peptidoglycan-binding domain-containing protein [Paenibacillus alvei]|uniref:LysM peptidoglycan-binding domain-containing protein n=1 Tax=Paenibacillus alvei TaxID=44250 RepID=UPI00227F0BA6|nr:LysM peptidoglycan-binding domain-containing protein [Paenibacillus alvei]MCY9736658.1 LysM peptidoglycan-binding domain-containing protein [Paenibacillus alvei]MCY9753656.1 LysM peptidoglycan-binding domain-containing protein [Paenibacillus alvei]
MNDESYGLRFDIYERVHLSDEVVGIDQLEEVELTPHIQVIPAGDQVTVRGSLLLAGAYVGADELRSSHSLEHWIPVEITLPLNRVRSLEDISVDIEHFDVDLLSTRTLNITGILSLRGISMESIEPAAWEPEQFTVVHQTEIEQDEEEPSWLRDYGTYTPAFTSSHEESLSESNGGSNDESNNESSNVESDADPREEYREYSSAWNSEEQKQEQDHEFMQDEEEEESESYTRAAEELEASEDETEDEQLIAQSNHEPSDTTSSNSQRVPLTWSGSQWNKEILEAEEQMEGQSAEASEDERQASSETNADSHEGEHVRTPKGAPSDFHTFSEEAHAREPVASHDKRERKERVSSTETDDSAAAQLSEELESLVSTHDDERESVEAGSVVNEQSDADPAAAVKQEMKIAIGKGKNSEPEAAEPLGFSSLLSKKREPQEPDRVQTEEETAKQAATNTEASGEEVKWQSLFLQRLDDERAFKKVRLCIVQRSETLDTIADRYSMNSREIALYNRLAESDVSEGQVLYIPTS